MSEQFTKVNNGLLVRAPGKINLSLLVKGKRPDGYHELETIMAKINWYDEILIERITQNSSQMLRCAQHDRYEPVIKLICKGPYEVPEGKDNLVYKAARLILDCGLRIADFSENTVCTRLDEAPSRGRTAHSTNKAASTGWKPVPQIRITLTKNIPAGTGLGSGSSDAAGTLMGINKFLKLGFSKKKLMELAARLGSDVAFFLGGPISFCTGRGEKVQKLPKSEFGVFLIVPDISVSTKRVYGNYQHDSAKYEQFHRAISGHIKKKRIDLVGELCANMLQESCFELNTKLRELKKGIERMGIGSVCLSGSGSSMYCIVDKGNEEKIKTYQNKLAREFGCKSMIFNNNSW